MVQGKVEHELVAADMMGLPGPQGLFAREGHSARSVSTVRPALRRLGGTGGPFRRKLLRAICVVPRPR